MPTHRITTLLITGSLLCASPWLLQAKGDAKIERLAKENAGLRRQVEEATAKLASQRQAADTKNATLQAELAELELQAERAVARRDALRKLVAARRAKLEGQRARAEQLRAPLLTACDQLKDAISKTSPLQRDARLARVTAIQDKVRARTLSAGDAIGQLARLVDDELELAQTTQLTRHVLKLENKSHLIPVVALGTALMYWRLEDGRAGFLAKTQAGWEPTQVKDPAHKAAIEALYEAERSAGRVPVLTLPLPAASTLRGAQD